MCLLHSDLRTYKRSTRISSSCHNTKDRDPQVTKWNPNDLVKMRAAKQAVTKETKTSPRLRTLEKKNSELLPFHCHIENILCKPQLIWEWISKNIFVVCNDKHLDGINVNPLQSSLLHAVRSSVGYCISYSS